MRQQCKAVGYHAPCLLKALAGLKASVPHLIHSSGWAGVKTVFRQSLNKSVMRRSFRNAFQPPCFPQSWGKLNLGDTPSAGSGQAPNHCQRGFAPLNSPVVKRSPEQGLENLDEDVIIFPSHAIIIETIFSSGLRDLLLEIVFTHFALLLLREQTYVMGMCTVKEKLHLSLY